LKIIDVLKGMIIGVANIIPGVSGGTLALVLGVYERLIGAIHKISFQTLKATLELLTLKKDGWKNFNDELKRIDAYFLISIGAGALVSIGATAGLMTYLLEHFHNQTYGFFCGLVIVSAWVPFKLIRKHSFFSVSAAVIAIAGIIALSSSLSDEQKISREQTKHEIKLQKTEISGNIVQESFDHSPTHLLYIVMAGAVGISAMILPGISGSFLLLLMGVYFIILKSITQLDLLTLFSFSLGCLIGILSFTRFINFALKKWYDVTTSFLLGLVIGSLVAIWPFKENATIGGEIVYLSNKWPEVFGNNEIMTIFSALMGGLIVWMFILIENKKKHQIPKADNTH
jgi:putative membrane protein